MPKKLSAYRAQCKQVPAYYAKVDELVSVYHMILEQAISAVVTVLRRMLGLD